MLNKVVCKGAIVGVAVLFGGGVAFAQTGMSGAKSAHSGSSTMMDSTFAREAAEGGMAEVKLGQLAEDHASSQAVKDFGKWMVEDHSKADDQLKSVASSENMTLPDKIGAKEQAQYDRLSKLSGTAFDRAYMRDMLADHRADIAEFQHEANDGKNEQIKSFASNTLPTLHEHLKLAEQTEQGLTASAANHSGK